MSSIVNVVLYQAGWLACVLGAAHGMPWAGVVAAAAIVAWHLSRAGQPRAEARLIAAAIVVGAVFETLLVQAGWVRYAEGALVAGTAPVWMVALWAMFATTLNVSLRPLRTHPWVAAVLGAVGAPLAYYAGARLGALQLADFHAGLAAIAIGWAWLTPLLLASARRNDGFTRP